MTDIWHNDPEAWYEAPESADNPEIVTAGDGCAFAVLFPVIVLALYVLANMAWLLIRGAG